MFYYLKGPKENFLNNPTVWQINPAKNEFWTISKTIFGTSKYACALVKLLNSVIVNQFHRIFQKNRAKTFV